MSYNNPLPTELDEQELLEVARLYRILRALVEKPSQASDDRTPLDKRWDQLEEYNPFLSRHELRGKVKDNTPKEEYDSLLAQFSIDL